MGVIPTFLILGAPKCGTTSLYHFMGQHPDVCFSRPKEPVFFEAEWERGLDFYRERYFGDWKGEKAVGEGRTYNLYLPYVPERIFRSLPDARLIAILRNPVDRAYSHWWHRFSRRIEPLPFEEAVEANRREIERGPRFEGAEGIERWSRGLLPNRVATRYRTYLDVGHYAEQIARYRNLFPTEQLRIVLFDDLVRDAQGTVESLWRFAGVEPGRVQLDLTPRNEALDEIESAVGASLSRHPRLRRLARPLPAGFKRGLRRVLRGRSATRPRLDPSTRSSLVTYFEPHVRALEELLDRSLQGWRR